MDLAVDASLNELEESLRAFFADPRYRYVDGLDAQTSEALQSRIWSDSVRLGWTVLGRSERIGGPGAGPQELVVLFHQLGRTLTPGPWLGTSLTHVVASMVDDARTATATDGPDLKVALAPVPTWAAVEADRRTRAYDWDGGVTHCLVVAEDGVALLPVLPQELDPGSLVESWDLSMPAAAIQFSEASILPQLSAEQVAAVHGHAVLLAAAMACGVAEHAVHMAAGHARTRVQFGRPIGSFQAVKHRCASMLIRERAATAQVRYAAAAMAAGLLGWHEEVDAAMTVAVDASIQNTQDCIQTCGAMGFTWEFDAQRYLKRALTIRAIGVQLRAGARAWWEASR